MASLTKRQSAVYEFIRRYIEAYGFPPTVREIAARFGIASPNGAVCHPKALEERGLIIRRRNTSRAIRLVEQSTPRDTLQSLLGAIHRLGGRITREPEYREALASFL